jgi:small subunit ribosomal protein S16
MLVIRLSRVGRKNDPSFRVVLQEKHRAPSAKAIEYLGSYNAKLKQKSLKADRIKYWISEGAQTSDTVHNLLVDEKIIESSKRKASTTRKKSNTESQTKEAQVPVESTEPKIETKEPEVLSEDQPKVDTAEIKKVEEKEQIVEPEAKKEKVKADEKVVSKEPKAKKEEKA